MNIRSQVPSQMRHEQKCEDSSGSSDGEDDAEDSEEAEARRARVAKATSMALGMVNAGVQMNMDIFGFEQKTDFTVDNPQYVLSTTKRLS